MLRKNFITHAVGIIVLALGIYLSLVSTATSDIYVLGQYIKSAGIFALSGSITNWLAVYMLFERVPLLYGSGVIPNNFVAFKSAIREMMLENFFNEKNFNNVMHEIPNDMFNIDSVISQIDENEFFNVIVETVQASQFGSMIQMFGGKNILEGLREPFNQKFREKIATLSQDIDFSQIIDTQHSYENMREKIETMIDTRLEELTASHVKMIIEEMIKNHLGWLVVWGGCFGGLIGILFEFLSSYI